MEFGMMYLTCIKEVQISVFELKYLIQAIYVRYSHTIEEDSPK